MADTRPPIIVFVPITASPQQCHEIEARLNDKGYPEVSVRWRDDPTAKTFNEVNEVVQACLQQQDQRGINA